MSIIFTSSRKKRELWEDNSELSTTSGTIKKTRHIPPTNGFHLQGCTSNKVGLLITLRDLFPMLDEKTIATVLNEYGDNLEAAIAKLEQLQLNPQMQKTNGTPDINTSSVTSLNSHVEPEVKETTITSRWIYMFLNEISGASNLDNLKLRVEAVLGNFEEAAIQNYKDNSEEMKEAKREFETTKKNSVILCKALVNKQERYKAQDQELARLQEVLRQAEERIKSLEVSNYSLTMHLERAIGPRASHPGTPPDIY